MRAENMEKTAEKTVITVVGKDTVGIIARVCTYLAGNSINVLDISQTIVQDFFNKRDRCYDSLPEGRDICDDAQNLISGALNFRGRS